MSRTAQTTATVLPAVLVATALGLAAEPAGAQTLAALVDGKTIAWIDAKAKKVTGSVPLAGGASLVGIDVRPADGKLYGLTASGTIVTLDPKTGKWEKKADLSVKLPAGATLTVDFNPVADRLRVLGSDGTSLRINVDDGKTIVDGRLKYAETDAHKGKTPNVIAGAYSESFKGTKATTLYDIDATAGTLLRQVPPNDGTLNTIGSLGVKVSGPVAFDIWSDGKGANAAWLVAGGALHRVDLSTGKATAVGAIAGLTGKVGDIAILP